MIPSPDHARQRTCLTLRLPGLRRSILSRFLIGLLLVPLAGCAYMQSPSILTTAPPTVAPAPAGSHESKGGFSVLVGAPGQPNSERVLADINAYARQRGFVPEWSAGGTTRSVSGKIMLDVFLRESDLHVMAMLHCVGLSRRYAEDFYRGFNKEYAVRYGEENPIIASDFEPYVRTPL